MSVRTNAQGYTPRSGILRLYVDGTAGSDAADGLTWGTAWKTSGRLEIGIAELLFVNPTALIIEVFVRNTIADLHVAVNTSGGSLVYVGQHVDEMTAYRTGTVAAVGGEAPAPKHNMQRLTIAGAALDGTEVGMTALLTDPVTGTNRGTATIVRVNVASQYVWITQPIGGLPAWVAASPADFTVRVPSAYVDGEAEFEANGFYRASDVTTTTVVPMCGFLGLRSRTLTLSGTHSPCAVACYVRRTTGTWGTVRCRASYAVGQYYSYVAGGVAYYIPDVVAQDYGLTGGPTPIQFNIVGNGCGSWNVFGGEAIFCGYADDTASAQRPSAFCASTYASAKRFDAIAMCYQTANNVIVRGGSRALFAEANGVLAVRYVSGLDLPAAGVPAFFNVSTGGVIRVLGAELEVDNTGTGSCDLAKAEIDGVIEFAAAIPDTAKAKTRQLVVDGGRINAVGIAMTTARAGGGPDLYVRDGVLAVAGNITKGAKNTAPSAMLQVARGGSVVQTSGSFTPVTPAADWPTEYGAKGAIIADDGPVDIRLGTLTGGLAGTTGIAATVKNGARLVHAGAGLAGVAPLDLGGAAAPQAWPAGVVTDVGEAAPQLCMVAANVA